MMTMTTETERVTHTLATEDCCANIRAAAALTVGQSFISADDFGHSNVATIVAVLADGWVKIQHDGLTFDHGDGPGVEEWPAAVVAAAVRA